MTGKKYRLVISVFVAIAMILPAGVFVPTTTAIPKSSGPQEAPEPKELPTPPGEHGTSGTELFIEGFVTGFGQFTPADNSGDGNWTWNQEGWVDWNQTTYTDTEDDTLTATVDLTNVTPNCVSGVWLKFDYWGDGGTFALEIDGNPIGTYVGGVKTTETVDLTAYIGAPITLGFHVTGTPSRNFSIDNVIVYVPSYNTDIFIEDIDGIYIEGGVAQIIDFENGGRYQKLPAYIVAQVTNNGIEDIVGADFHLQIYKEEPMNLMTYKYWDMEACFLLTWDVFSWDGDQATWYWTEKRSHSPTHSYHTQPDYLATYERDAWDSLILHEWFHIPDVIQVGDLSIPVTGAYLAFWHWCEGELAGGAVPVDYGRVYIDEPTGSTPVTGAIYDTAGEWEWYDPYFITDPQDTDGRAPISLTSWLGRDIKINFTWVSDDYLNFEGWYVDDICIYLTLQSPQPLVDQGYQYVDIPAGATVNVSFPLEYTFEDGYYFFQVYSDYEDCNPDNHNLGHGYADEINWTIWFGDVCDGEITNIVAPAEVRMPNNPCGEELNYVEIPIDVTVHNSGTLTEDIPVELTASPLITTHIFKDDVESGDPGYLTGGFYIPTNLWHICDRDFYSPFHSWHLGQDPTGYPAGGVYYWILDESIVDYDALFGGNPIDKDIKLMARWNLNNVSPTNPDRLVVVIRAAGYIIYFSQTRLDGTLTGPYVTGNSAGWRELSFKTLIRRYTTVWGLPNDLEEFARFFTELYGGTYPQDFHGYGLGLFAVGWNVAGLSNGYVYLDNVDAYREDRGAPIWSDTLVAEDLEPCHTEVLHFVWNTTEYCNYALTATVRLNCDMDPTNNERSTRTRIYKQIYENDTYIDWYQEDNTFGLPDHWHVVKECSICPADHFWWNGDESEYGYVASTDDVLIVNRGFNTSDQNPYLEIDFDTKYMLEEDFDFGLVEISNDSFYWDDEAGKWVLDTKGTWWVVGQDSVGNSGWFTGTSTSWPDFDHISLQIAPGTILIDWNSGASTDPSPIDSTFFSTPVAVRFRMFSDDSVQIKGWFIDNVNISYTDAGGVTHWQDFYDTMEDPAFTAANWLHMATYTGCHWHEEYTFDGYTNARPTFWNGEWRDYTDGLYGYYYDYMLGVDEKLILTLDLTHAFEAFFEWDQNYSFNGSYSDGDYGFVDIWTGKEWKTLFIAQGNTGGGWGHMRIDISDYVGGSELTKIRFRFVSNGDFYNDYGWLIDNISVQGKIDYKNPTVAATLNPATPNGCNGWYKTGVTITLTATDNVKVTAIYYRIDGGAWKLYTAPFTVDVDGAHTVDYYSVDEVGNTSPVGTVSFKIDKTAPTVTITAPEAGYIYLMGRQLFKNPLGKTIIIGGIYFEATASDATSGIDYISFNINGYTYDDASAPYKIWWHKFDLIPKSYTLTVSAYDEACNKAADQTLTFTHWL